MKKWVLALFFVLFATYAFSQTWFVGGSIGASFNNSENRPQGQEITFDTIDTHVNISVSPSVGININKFDFGINAKFGYEYFETKYQNAPPERTNHAGPEVLEIGAGLFSRYNFVTFGNFSILVRLDADYLFQNRMDDPVLDKHRIDINLRPVFQYRLFDRLLIFSNFGIYGIYYTYVSLPNHTTTINNFGVSLPSFFGLSDFSLGFYIIL